MQSPGGRFGEQTEEDVKKYITDFRKRYKGRVVIPAHHYVPADVIEFADFTGDSYKLAVEAASTDAQWIVFCGVFFMAEGVDTLVSGNRKVIIPDTSAGCPMADMIDRQLGLKALSVIKDFSGEMPAPVIYMNSYADAKSLCGEHDGAVCTSSNAEKIMNHYLSKGKKLFFFPDRNLGINTAKAAGLADEEIALVARDFTIKHNSSPDRLKVFLWDGMCPVHHKFKVDDVKGFRKKYPEGTVIVHPEVRPEIASLADIQGSTQKIYNLVSKSPSGSVWGIGTEHTFVKRLSGLFSDRTIIPLAVNTCTDMNKINLYNLAESLYSIEEFEKGRGDLKYLVKVPDVYKENARKALDRMISIVEEK